MPTTTDRCEAVDDAFRRCRRRAGHEGEHKASPPGTPLQNLRCDTDLWQAARAKANANGTNLTAVIVAFLRRYVAR